MGKKIRGKRPHNPEVAGSNPAPATTFFILPEINSINLTLHWQQLRLVNNPV